MEFQNQYEQNTNSKILVVRIKVTKLLSIFEDFHRTIEARCSKYPLISTDEEFASFYQSKVSNSTIPYEVSSVNDFLKTILSDQNKMNGIRIYNRVNSRRESMISELKFLEQFSAIFSDFKLKASEKLSLLTSCLSNPNLSTLKFESVNDYSDFLEYYMSYSQLRLESMLVFFKEMWGVLKIFQGSLLNSSFKVDPIVSELDERMILYFNGYYKLSKDHSEFQLHQAVFNKSTKEVFKICNRKSKNSGGIFYHIDELDRAGNTPLLLALKLKHYEIAEILCDLNASIHSPYPDQVSALEYVLATNNLEGLKILVIGMKKQRFSSLEEDLKFIYRHLKQLPNFSISFKLTFDSNVLSIFRSFTPNDSFRIIKKGGNLKIDLNISKAYFKGMKGRTAILLQEKGNKICIFKIDYDRKQCVDFMTSLYSEISSSVDRDIEQIVKDGLSNRSVCIQNLEINEVKDKVKIRQTQIQHFTTKGKLVLLDTTLKISNDRKDIYSELLKFSNFPQYLAYYKMAEEGAIDLKNWNSSSMNYSKSSKNLILRKEDEGIKTDQDIMFTEQQDMGDNDALNSYFGVRSLRTTKQKEIMYYCEKQIKAAIKQKTSHSKDSKDINLSFFFSESIELKLLDFYPILHILTLNSSDFDSIKTLIFSNQIPFSKLPLKVSFPVGMTFYGLLEVCYYSREDEPDSVFEINFDNFLENNKIDNTFEILNLGNPHSKINKFKYMLKGDDSCKSDTDTSLIDDLRNDKLFFNSSQILSLNDSSSLMRLLHSK